jgi:hypothetical protein
MLRIMAFVKLLGGHNPSGVRVLATSSIDRVTRSGYKDEAGPGAR